MQNGILTKGGANVPTSQVPVLDAIPWFVKPFLNAKTPAMTVLCAVPYAGHLAPYPLCLSLYATDICAMRFLTVWKRPEAAVKPKKGMY